MPDPASPDDPDADGPAVLALAEALSLLVGRLKRRFREQATFDLSPSQIGVLRRLEKSGPTTVSTLARGETMRPQSMGAIIAALQEQGLVEGHPDPDDGRQTLWSLTPACLERMVAGRAARHAWLSGRIEARLSAAERSDLQAAIELLSRLADP